MKKILFATTALVATAGVAAADVTFGGFGRFGVSYEEGRFNDLNDNGVQDIGENDSETQLTATFHLQITGETTSDGGITFGAHARFHELNRAGALNLARFYMTTGGLTVSLGNTLGAIDSMPNIYTGTFGLTAIGDAVVAAAGIDGYSSANGNFGIDVMYTMGDFGVHLSHTPDDQYLAGISSGTQRTALAASYSFGDYTVSAGIQDSTNAGDNEWIIGFGGSMGGVDFALHYADNGTSGDAISLGAEYAVSAATKVMGFIKNDEAMADETAYGIGVQHDLGGGVSIRGGLIDLHGATVADLGVRFNF